MAHTLSKFSFWNFIGSPEWSSFYTLSNIPILMWPQHLTSNRRFYFTSASTKVAICVILCSQRICCTYLKLWLYLSSLLDCSLSLISSAFVETHPASRYQSSGQMPHPLLDFHEKRLHAKLWSYFHSHIVPPSVWNLQLSQEVDRSGIEIIEYGTLVKGNLLKTLFANKNAGMGVPSACVTFASRSRFQDAMAGQGSGLEMSKETIAALACL